MSDELVLRVNGKAHSVQAPPDTPLLYVLRNELGLNSAQFGCGLEQCGACMVLMGKDAKPSCKVPAFECAGVAITTLEGLSPDGSLHPVQRAYIEQQAAQCGFCINGMMMKTVELLGKQPHPTDEQVRAALDGNLCRCGTHLRILRAVRRAEALMNGSAKGEEWG